MPRISLWNPYTGTDTKFIDRLAGESLRTGGVGVLVHKYVGPASGGDETTIDDVLLLENRSRKYDENVYNLKCLYTPQDTEFDLSQFGIFLSSDIIRIDFHLTDMNDVIGRKLMSGDVLEFVHVRDKTLSGESINKFYVIQDGMFSSSGFGATWNPHFWKIKAKELTDSEEFKDIVVRAAKNQSAGKIGNGLGLMPLDQVDTDNEICSIKDAISSYCKYIGISDKVKELAEEQVDFDPKYVEVEHLYISVNSHGYPTVSEWLGGRDSAPNGQPLKGIGTEFPEDMTDGEYFLRIDFTPDRLFQKQGNRYVRIYDNLRRIWTAFDQSLDPFINNTNIVTLQDGTKVEERQGLSQTLASRDRSEVKATKKKLKDKEVSDNIKRANLEKCKPLDPRKK